MNAAPPTILIVDDQNTSSLEKLLREDGYRILTANSGPAALAQVSSHAVDLVLLDIAMPGMDGYEVMRRIRAQPHGDTVPILLVSAQYTDSDDVARGLQVGADDYLLKPFEDLIQLRARIGAKLRQRALEVELREARQEAERQNRMLRRALGIVQTAASSLDPDSLAATIHRGLHNELRVERAAVWRPHPLGHPVAVPPSAEPLPEGAWAAIQAGEPMVARGGRVILPMCIAGSLEGVLDLERADGWNEGAITILQAMTDSLAILFQNTRYVQQIARENLLHELLNRLAAQDAALAEMLRELQRFLNTHLLLVDRMLNLVVSEPLPGMVEEGQLRAAVVELYQSEGLMEQLARRRRAVVVEARGAVPFHRVFPVVLGGEVTALLLTVPTEGTTRATLAPEGELERSARFLAGVLQRRSEVALREQNLRADFLNDFLAGRLADEMSRPSLFLRANALGLNLAQPGFVAQLELPGFDQLVDWTQPLFARRADELLAPLLRDAQQARRALDLDGIEVMVGERVVVLVSLPPHLSEEQARARATRWTEQLLALHDRRAAHAARPAIGLGRRAANWRELPRSADEAERALRWALSNPREGAVYYGDLGSERLLAAVGDRRELERFHDEQLAPIVAYDRAREGDLVHTLECFFANRGQIARAAQVLAIHPNTLKYRLDQVEHLTHRDPRSPDAALDLQLALKIHRML